MEINISEIPDFLQDSEFYKNLDLNSNELITIPELKITDEINNITDFKKLFKTLDFFGVDKFPNNFIEYYLNNSEDVFDYLKKKKSSEYKNLLVFFCNLKIENHNQFFITYKIINLYKLNPEDYDNYIEYGINFLNSSIFLNEVKNLKNLKNLDYKMFIKRISWTEILELKDYKILYDDISVTVTKKNLLKEWKISKSIIPIESVSEIINAIKNNIEYQYEKKTTSSRKNVPYYKDNQLFLIYHRNKSNITEPITINTFNKNIILEEFRKIAEFINMSTI